MQHADENKIMNRKVAFWLLFILMTGIVTWSISSLVNTAVSTSESQSTNELLTVAGQSMLPTLRPGDKVTLEKAAHSEFQRGELLAIAFSTRERKMLKRVIAIPGDNVEFIEGRLKLNGDWLATDWWPVDKKLAPRGYKIISIQLKHYNNVIPKNTLIVMGDNAGASYDSGDYGMISVSQVAGRISAVK